jgi:phage-related protein (TIGR01555 family)
MAAGRAELARQRELRGPDGAPVMRADAWANYQTGIGTQADKTMHGYFEPVWRIDDQQLTNLYNGSSLVAKMVEKPAREMFRRGYALKNDAFEESELEDLRQYALDTFQVDDELRKGKTFGDLFGGFVDILLADDGNLPSEPLDESRIKTFRGINGVDRRFAYVLDYYNDPLETSKFGRPKHYLISNAVAGFSYTPSGVNPTALQNPIGRRSPEELRRRGFGTTIIHESRLLRWSGIETDQVTMQTLAGWGWSKIQRVYDTLRDFEHAFRSAGYLLSDAAQGVIKLKKLFDTISAGNLNKVHQRTRFLEEMRSVMRMIVLDSDQEDFTRVATPMTGIPEMLDRFMLRLAADMDMPETELFGRAPQGLNATGENERKKWFDLLAGFQTSEIAPALKRFYHLLSLAADSPVKRKKSASDKTERWTIEFHPLYAPTDKEEADTELAIAQRDQIMLDEGVVTPEEVFLSRQEWYPSANVELREKAIEGQESFDPYANDEPEVQLVGGETPSPNVGLPVPGTPGANNPTAVPGAPGTQAPQGETSGLAKRPAEPLRVGGSKADRPGASKPASKGVAAKPKPKK